MGQRLCPTFLAGLNTLNWLTNPEFVQLTLSQARHDSNT